jgi:hypothetical protein
LTGTLCHSFSDILILIPLIPERGRSGHAGAVQGRADPATQKVNIGHPGPVSAHHPLLAFFLASKVHCELRNGILEQGIQGLPQEFQGKLLAQSKQANSKLVSIWSPGF